MKVRCPACQKSAQLPESEAGQMAVCTACGALYTLPLPPPEATTKSETRVEVREEDLALSQGGRALAALWVGAAVGLCAVALLGVLGLHQWEGARQRQSRAKLVEINRDAESLTATGRRARVMRRADDKRTAIATRAASTTHVAQALVPPATQPLPSPQAAALVQPARSPQSGADFGTASVRQPRVDRPQPLPPPAIPRPPIAAVIEHNQDLTDEQIGDAIRHGADALLARFSPTTRLLPDARDPDGYGRGMDILCVYALMQCGQAIDDPRLNVHEATMRELIAAMKSLPLGNYHFETYSRGLRATALALYNRPEDREVLRQDAVALVRGTRGGAYSYELPHSGNPRLDSGGWDNSNSQYGLLGVWSAAETAFEVPQWYWQSVQHHWEMTQHPSGQWGYFGGRTLTHSMTCAGLASLFVTHDYLDLPVYGTNVGRDPFTPALWRGLKWLEEDDNCIDLNRGGYDLYGLERVAFASGFKFFGEHDWYRELAQQTIQQQQSDGSWGTEIETAYHLLFLARGRHPILMNKLRFDGYWANRPRDVANLARFASHQLERPLNWQVVPLKNDWTEWVDSPILYLASHRPPRFSEDDVHKIRMFIENGGLLFTQADGDSPDFNRFARELAHRLFRDYEMQDLPPTHPLCSAMYRIEPPTGSLKIVANGSRILMLHSTTDLSRYWQMRDDKSKASAFEFGTNLFIYAAGRRDLRNRLVSTYIPPVHAPATQTFRLARLKYNGNWDPEPAAWTRFGRWFQLQTGYALDIRSLPIRDLKPDTAPVADLTGTARYDLTDAEVASIKNYVESGGVLLIDACGGAGAFDKAMQSDLFKAFPDVSWHVLSSTHPMLNASGDGMEDLSRPRLRQFAVDALGTHWGFPRQIKAGRGHVIVTDLDLTTGLLGTNTWGILGYDPAYAQALVKNAILWTLDGQRDAESLAKR